MKHNEEREELERQNLKKVADTEHKLAEEIKQKELKLIE